METSQSITVLSTHSDRPAISQGGCRLNVLLRLNAPPLARARSERQPVALAVVIDRSGSMAGAKLQAACAAAQQLVRQLTPADRICVISFDSEVRTVVPLSPPSEEAITRIGRIRSGGQTALFDGWRSGMESLLQAEELQHHQKRVLLLTDGQANVGLRRRSEVAPWVGTAQESAISTSCIGLGEDYEERLLIAMAEAGGGNLVHLTAPQQLEAIFQAELEGLNLTLGRDLRLRVGLAEGVALERLYNPIEPTTDGWIPLGSLQAGTTPTLALQLLIAPAVASAAGAVSELLQVEARWITPDGEREQLEALLRLPVVDPLTWEQLAIDPEVQREVLLQEAGRQRQRAMEGIDQGDLFSTRGSVEAALCSLEMAEASPEVEKERQLLHELLDLISTNKLSLARKVMGTQAFNRARSRKLRNQESSDAL